MGIALVVAGVVATAGMVAFVTTSDCFADPFCDNLGVAWSALTVGAVVFTVVFTGYLVWTLFGKAAD